MEEVGFRGVVGTPCAGGEVAVHARHSVFKSPETEVMILVDAVNAFNLLNRQAVLQNIRHLCPPLSKLLFNTYL